MLGTNGARSSGALLERDKSKPSRDLAFNDFSADHA